MFAAAATTTKTRPIRGAVLVSNANKAAEVAEKLRRKVAREDAARARTMARAAKIEAARAKEAAIERAAREDIAFVKAILNRRRRMAEAEQAAESAKNEFISKAKRVVKFDGNQIFEFEYRFAVNDLVRLALDIKAIHERKYVVSAEESRNEIAFAAFMSEMNQHYTKMKNILVDEDRNRIQIFNDACVFFNVIIEEPVTEMNLLDLYKKVQRRHFLNNGVVVV